MWRRRPGLMLLGLVPALVVLVLIGGALVALLLTVGDVVSWATSFADDWNEALRTALQFGLAVLVVLVSLFVASAVFTGLTLAVGEAFYSRIWREAELMLGGDVPEDDLSFWRSVRDGLALAAYGLLAAVVVIIIGLIPLVGAVVGVVLGLLVSGRLLAGELLIRPLEPRGLDRADRRSLIAGHRATVLGFGVTTQLFFLIPMGAVVVMPAAVVGATMLARDLLPGWTARMPGRHDQGNQGSSFKASSTPLWKVE